MKIFRIMKYMVVAVAVLTALNFLWQKISRMEAFEKEADAISSNISAAVEPAVMPAHVSAPFGFAWRFRRGSNGGRISARNCPTQRWPMILATRLPKLFRSQLPLQT